MSSSSSIVAALSQTLSPTNRKAAEKELERLEFSAGFAISLLEVVRTMDDSIGISAAIYFKNYVHRLWPVILLLHLFGLFK